jgi:hypothetical protein
VPAGFHAYTHFHALFFELAVELLGFFAVRQPPFSALSGFGVPESNLLEARMIITAYNQHVRLLSSEPFGCFALPKSTRAWEPTLLWNHYTHLTRFWVLSTDFVCLLEQVA